MKSYDDILDRIEKPLAFISRDEFRILPQVRDFTVTMAEVLRRLRDTPLAADCPEGLSRLDALFSDFDGLPLSEKRIRLQEAMQTLQAIRAKGPLTRPSASTPHDSGTGEGTQRLSRPLQFIKGIGPRLAALFARKGLMTVEDVLYFLPRRYEDRRVVRLIGETALGRRETIIARVLQAETRSYARRRSFEATLADESGHLVAKWFHGDIRYLAQSFRKDQRMILTGEINQFQHMRTMIHPDFEVLDEVDREDSLHFQRIVPVYSETEGLRQKTLRRLIYRVVDQYAEDVSSPIPESICARRRLIDIRQALRTVHFPSADQSLEALNAGRSEAHRRLIYDEFFFFQLALAMKKQGQGLDGGIAFQVGGPLVERFYRSLPFRMTSAQERAIREIESDMARPAPMNRLLQGDVGCGKTVVAMAAMIAACENGYQAALMAPTEILAQQHFRNMTRWAEPIGLHPVLLTGQMTAPQRRSICEQIDGTGAQIIVGTHALIQEGITFRNLGLVVVDEQHRFGVMERAALRAKGGQADVLVMTATPIPRTLAMTVYGDLDVSVIDELPPGKVPIKTKLFMEQHRPKVYERIRREVEKGNQVFVVYPLVDASEALDLKDATRMARHLQEDVFPDYGVGLIHGKMRSREKEQVMTDFSQKRVQLLVATTVIEVGIDIPEASLMVIEHAERFGLSQLHQLRGRVGRGRIAGSCILMTPGSGSQDARKRLKVMEETGDGFRIAEADLAIRGPGEFMGTRQSGLPDFRIADIIRDGQLLQEARSDAFALLVTDPGLARPDHATLRKVLLQRWQGRLEVARVG